MRAHAVILREKFRHALELLKTALREPLVRMGVLGSLLVALGAHAPIYLPQDAPPLRWSGPGELLVGTLLFFAGAALLTRSWWFLAPFSRGRPQSSPPCASRLPRLRLLQAASLLWALPLAVAPPILSRDAYSYAAQGLLLRRGMDPYSTGPVAVPGEFAAQVDPLWLFTPAPYGPLTLRVQELLVLLSGEHAYLATLLMRVPAYLALFILILALPRLACLLGGSPARALWLGAANPLMVLHLVGGAHNDGLAVAFLLLSILAVAQGSLRKAILWITLAIGFKQTMAVGMLAVAGLHARRLWRERRGLEGDETPREPAKASPTSAEGAPPWGLYLGSLVLTGTLTLAAFALVTLVSGLGWGWIEALGVPASVRSLLAPPSLLAGALEVALSLGGASHATVAAVFPLVKLLASLAMAMGILASIFLVGRARPVRSTVYCFALVCLLGPVVHPWYLFPLLTLAGTLHASRRWTYALSFVSLTLLAYGILDTAVGNGVFFLVAVLLVALVRMLMAWRRARRAAPWVQE